MAELKNSVLDFWSNVLQKLFDLFSTKNLFSNSPCQKTPKKREKKPEKKPGIGFLSVVFAKIDKNRQRPLLCFGMVF
jgi:hypothetical protein